MGIILTITGIVGGIMTVLCLYQIVYTIIGFFKTKKYTDAKMDHEYAVIIPGRNEGKVIGQLIDSIRNCDYDQSKIRIFVIADNCTDNTAEVARKAGATVFERFNKEEIGKGYAVDFLLKKIHETEPDYLPEGWFVFDADNLLHKDYIKEMNKAFDAGEEVVTSLRNGKNFNTNWYSAVGCMAFMRECRFFHTPRTVLGVSANVTGTGWLVKNTLLNYETGFPWHLLTEDAEFTHDVILRGHKIAYQDTAIFYDEQPTNLKTIYKQRLRWQSGTYQNMKKFTGKLAGKLFTTGKFVYFDYLVSLLPFAAIGFMLVVTNFCYPVVNGIVMLCKGAEVWGTLWYMLSSLLALFATTYLGIFIYGVLVTFKDWKRMAASTKSKLVATFMYPIFMILIMPIPFIAIFKKAKWVHIPHTDARDINELNKLLGPETKKEESEKKENKVEKIETKEENVNNVEVAEVKPKKTTKTKAKKK